MNLKHLEYFIKVAELGSISKAAHAFYLKPSNLSSCMKNIEEEFGAVLFIRNTKGVILTNEGKDVLNWAQNVLNTKDGIIKKFQKQKSVYSETNGTINFYIGASINQNIHINLYTDFFTKYPQVIMKVEESNTNGVIQQVLEVPQAIGISIFNQKMLQEIEENPELSFLSIRKVKLFAFAAKNSAYAKEYNSLSIKTLLSLPTILYAPTSETEPLIAEIFSEYGQLNIASQTSNVILFHSLLNTGKYIALGIDDLSGGLDAYKSIPIRDKINISLGMIYKTKEKNNPLINIFLDYFATSK